MSSPSGLLLLALGANEQQFHTGWFIESLFTQVLVVLVIRTVAIPFSPIGPVLGFASLPWGYWALLAALVAAYLTLVELVKRRFDRPPSAETDAARRGTVEVWGVRPTDARCSLKRGPRRR